MSQNRRNFLKSLGIGAAASMLTPGQLWSNAREPIVTAIKAFTGTTANNEEVFWETIREQFHFAEGLTYFNNGSLGACPTPIREAAHTFRSILDDFPSMYMWGGWENEKETVRKQVADLFSVSAEEIALIHNTTEGMNLIARSMELQTGDEVILADHEHTSAVAPWTVWQAAKGIRLIRPTLPILPKSVDEIVAIYRKAIGPKTKVISICHLVNTNGMILPIKEITEMAHEKGILVAVDGAQGAGMFHTDLENLGCDFYTVSAHKWLFSPKGIGIFYAKKDVQPRLKPLLVARGYEDTSIRRLENYNTRNLPELLALGAAVDYRNAIGPQKIHDRTFELKHYLRNLLHDHPKLRLKTPEPDALSAGIQAVEVVGKEVQVVKERLFEEYGIDCRPMSKFGLNAVRLSLAIFISKKQIDDLVNALNAIATS